MDTNTALELRRAYFREYNKNYREKNKEKIIAQRKEWRKNNPTKQKEYDAKYWAKKAEKLMSEK